jgi:hypothetical protein
MIDYQGYHIQKSLQLCNDSEVRISKEEERYENPEPSRILHEAKKSSELSRNNGYVSYNKLYTSI